MDSGAPSGTVGSPQAQKAQGLGDHCSSSGIILQGGFSQTTTCGDEFLILPNFRLHTLWREWHGGWGSSPETPGLFNHFPCQETWGEIPDLGPASDSHTAACLHPQETEGSISLPWVFIEHLLCSHHSARSWGWEITQSGFPPSRVNNLELLGTPSI